MPKGWDISRYLSMNGKHFLGQFVSDFERYDDIGPITAVELRVDEKQSIWAGDKNGYVLEVECPYGTQTMANNILASVQGKTYKSFRAKNAGLPITAELGDALTVNNVYTMFAYQHLNFGSNNRSEISAPGSHEAEHEFPYISSTQKELNRLDNGIRSYITKTNQEINLRIEEIINGNVNSFSEINQKLDSITLQVNNQNTTISSIKLDLNGIRSSYVTKDELENTVETSINQSIDGITATFIKKSEAETLINNSVNVGINGIELRANNGSKSSTISLRYGNTTISSANVQIKGMVTFNDLETEGQTIINGGNITTGTIYAGDVSITGKFDVFDTDGTYGGTLGYVSGYAYNENNSVRRTDGIGITGMAGRNAYGGLLICTDAGARMGYDGENKFGVSSTIMTTSSGVWWAGDNFGQASDIRTKNSIGYDVYEEYKGFYESLKPCKYKKNACNNDKFYLGFIAQDVKASLEKNGLTMKDFAGLAKMDASKDDGIYGLAYMEFISLNTSMIQHLMKEVESLKNEIKDLRGITQ